MVFHLGTLMPSAREGPPLRRHPPGRWGRSFHLSPPTAEASQIAHGIFVGLLAGAVRVTPEIAAKLAAWLGTSAVM